MADLKLKLILEAVDRVTRPIKAVGQAIQSINAPVRRLGDQLRAMAVQSGLPGALATLRNRFLLVGAAAAGAFYAVRRITAAGDQAVKMSQRVGVSAEDWQKMAYAAELADVSAAELGDSLKFLNRNAVSAATGSQEAATWFRRAGVNVRDTHGKLKPTRQLFEEISAKFAAMPDGAKKTALAMGLLGRSGESLIPFLNAGPAGLKQFYEEAEKLGIVMSEDNAKASEAFNDNLTRLHATMRGLLITVLTPLLPVFSAIAERIGGWARENRALLSSGVIAFVGLLSAVLIGKLLVATVAVTKAVIAFGAALFTTPIGWFLGGMALLGGAAYLLYKHWGPVKEWFAGLWGAIVETFQAASAAIEDTVRFLVNTVMFPFVQMLKLVDRLMPASMRASAAGRSISGAVGWLDQPAQSPFGRSAAAAMQQVGGTIKIVFDDRGRPRVQEARPDSGNVDFEVETGVVMP